MQRLAVLRDAGGGLVTSAIGLGEARAANFDGDRGPDFAHEQSAQTIRRMEVCAATCETIPPLLEGSAYGHEYVQKQYSTQGQLDWPSRLYPSARAQRAKATRRAP